jgi:ethanolamine transporter EutH
MPKRLAACCALLVFALCLMLGMGAHNSFTTTVTRALVAMVCTFGIGLIVGAVAQKMLEENIKAEQERQKNPAPAPSGDG